MEGTPIIRFDDGTEVYLDSWAGGPLPFGSLVIRYETPGQPTRVIGYERGFERPSLMCCKLECPAPATWRVTFGSTPDDFTLSCDQHLAFHLQSSEGDLRLDGFVVTPAQE